MTTELRSPATQAVAGRSLAGTRSLAGAECASVTAVRHPRKVRTSEIVAAIEADRRAARAARKIGDADEAWRLLERTHILSQPWAWPHVRSHLDMLSLAIHARDRREIVGQIARTIVAGPGSAAGRYPLGNTGRANVPATRPMPVPDDLADILAG